MAIRDKILFMYFSIFIVEKSSKLDSKNSRRIEGISCNGHGSIDESSATNFLTPIARMNMSKNMKFGKDGLDPTRYPY